jgi:hypothetical protein
MAIESYIFGGVSVFPGIFGGVTSFFEISAILSNGWNGVGVSPWARIRVDGDEVD